MSKSDFISTLVALVIVLLFIGGLTAILFAGALQIYPLFGWGLLAMLSAFPLGFIGLAVAEGDA
jgi:hypothetical protein